MTTPSFLKNNAIIGIVSTARKISLEALEPCIKTLKDWGFRVEIADNIGKEDHQFAGTDIERTKAFQKMLDDNYVDAILCARGGYGSVRVIDRIDWSKFKAQPKWVCGYSDVTAIHSRIHKLGIQSLHSTMPINFEGNSLEALNSLKKALTGEDFYTRFPHHGLNRKGKAKGKLVGGNLSMLYSLLGSEDQLNTEGKILFIEDLDEYLYHIDRMMMALKRAGILKNLAGLVVGALTDMNDNAIPFGQTAEEIVKSAVEEYDYPIAFNYPAGHLDDNQALIFGQGYYLDVPKEKTALLSQQ